MRVKALRRKALRQPLTPTLSRGERESWLMSLYEIWKWKREHA